MNKYIFKYDQLSKRERLIIADNITDATNKFEKGKPFYTDNQTEIIERKIVDIKEIKPKPKYNFKIDRLLSVWETQNVCVEADSFEEAKEKLKEFSTFDDSDSEILYETMDVITPGSKFENTVAVYAEDANTGFYTYLKDVESL